MLGVRVGDGSDDDKGRIKTSDGRQISRWLGNQTGKLQSVRPFLFLTRVKKTRPAILLRFPLVGNLFADRLVEKTGDLLVLTLVACPAPGVNFVIVVGSIAL